MTMRRLALPTVALSVMLAAPSSAADRDKMIDYLKLWTECRPVYFLVEILDDHAANIGLRREDIKATILSRLRSARIYWEGERQLAPGEFSKVGQIYANVHIVGLAFHIRLEFKRLMQLQFSNTMGVPGLPVDGRKFRIPAAMWWTGVTGTHSGNAEFLLSVVARQTDKFIDEYLRVNQKACKKR